MSFQKFESTKNLKILNKHLSTKKNIVTKISSKAFYILLLSINITVSIARVLVVIVVRNEVFSFPFLAARRE